MAPATPFLHTDLLGRFRGLTNDEAAGKVLRRELRKGLTAHG